MASVRFNRLARFSVDLRWLVCVQAQFGGGGRVLSRSEQEYASAFCRICFSDMLISRHGVYRGVEAT